jgi:uncharacterized lipoprotein YmbA
MAGFNGSDSRRSRPQFRQARTPVRGSAFVAILVLAAACGGKIPPTNYYVLHFPPQQPASAKPLTATAVVMPLRASEMLTQDRIVYRETPEQVGFYEYHRWAEDPRLTITQAIIEQLRQRRTFRQVVLFDGRSKADYIIRGRLDRLEEVDYPEGVSVRVQLSVKLLDAQEAETLWQGAAEETGKVGVGEVRSVVAEMSAAARSGVEKLASELDTFLRANASQRERASAPLPPGEQR